jgi:hypothetical protein
MESMRTLWLSSPKLTFFVMVDKDDYIVKPAPICWKWKGRHISELIKYFGVDRVEELH